MSIVVVGVNHRSAPVAVRERLAMVADELPGALKALASYTSDGVILSTCNRTEIYAAASSPDEGFRDAGRFLSEYHRLPPEEITPYVYRHAGEEAHRHLFEVASGLDSMILGETEILGQVGSALASASEVAELDHTMSRLFHHALRTGRRARTETKISHHAASVSSAAVQMARGVFGGLDRCRVLVISAGQAGKLTARSLFKAGAAGLGVANRTRERADALARELGGRTVDFDRIPEALVDYDIVISASAAGRFVISAGVVEQAARLRDGRPLCLIDIAVPRDIDPGARGIRNVYLYDIDDLEAVALANREERQGEVARVRDIIGEEVVRFGEWLRSLEAVPVVSSLEDKAESIRQAELEKALKKLSHLSDKDRERVSALSKAITRKLLHGPKIVLKEQGQRHGYVEAARALFRLDD